jgi:hypothetical protein
VIGRGGGSFGTHGGLIGDELAHIVVSCVVNVADTDPVQVRFRTFWTCQPRLRKKSFWIHPV